MISLAHAFTYAGVPATVMSLWKVPDESTHKIMITFYQYLKAGMRKDAALRQAKLDYLNRVAEPELKHPYYWAGFVIMGNARPLAFKNNGMKNICIVLGIAAAICLIVAKLWQRRL